MHLAFALVFLLTISYRIGIGIGDETEGELDTTEKEEFEDPRHGVSDSPYLGLGDGPEAVTEEPATDVIAPPTPEIMAGGQRIATKVGQGICWYEYLKVLPDYTNPRSKKFGSCWININVDRLIEIWKEQKQPIDNWDFVKTNVAANINRYVIKFLPEVYQKCSTFMMEPESKFEKEMYLIGYEEPKVNYPYKGWANCMLSKLEESHSPKAVEALVQTSQALKFTINKAKWAGENSNNTKWENVLLERENENRQRHGSPNLTMDPEITGSAQVLADKLANDCQNFAGVMKSDDSTYKGKGMGSAVYLWNVGGKSPPENDALHVANVWYESGKEYPWPEFTGDGKDPLFQKFGWFSQQIWRATTRVGYGMGKAPSCNYTVMVAKYFPRGNIEDEYAENVKELTAE